MYSGLVLPRLNHASFGSTWDPPDSLQLQGLWGSDSTLSLLRILFTLILSLFSLSDFLFLCSLLVSLCVSHGWVEEPALFLLGFWVTATKLQQWCSNSFFTFPWALRNLTSVAANQQLPSRPPVQSAFALLLLCWPRWWFFRVPVDFVTRH